MPSNSKKESNKKSSIEGSTAGSTQTLEQFGRALFDGIKNDKVGILQSLAYSVESLTETIEAQTTDPEVRADIMRELEREGFDEEMKTEVARSYVRLKEQEFVDDKIDWKRITYSDFKFEEHEERTQKSNIVMGTGFLHFEYEGRGYKIRMRKMAKLIKGWRGIDLSESVSLEY